MAGTATYTVEKYWKDDENKLHHIAKVRFSAAYVAGGDTLPIGSMFRSVEMFEVMHLEDSGGYEDQVTDTNWADPDASGQVLHELYYGDWNAIADGPLIEAANGDYSAVYMRVHVIGLPA